MVCKNHAHAYNVMFIVLYKNENVKYSFIINKIYNNTSDNKRNKCTDKSYRVNIIGSFLPDEHYS